MIEILKKQWFVILIALTLIGFTSFVIYDKTKDVVKGKSVDGKDVVVSINDENILADDLYQDLYDIKSSNGKTYGDQILYMNFERAVADQVVETTSAIKSDAKKQATNLIENFKQQYGSDYKNVLATALKGVGYNNGEKDLENYFIPLLKVEKLKNDYMDAHMDELFTPIYEAKHSREIAHILIKIVDINNPTEEELAKVKSVEDALAEGKDFGEVAKEFSDDSSATNNGSLGYADDDTSYVEAFKEKAFSMAKGEVSEWVKVTSTNYSGWHMIKVLETEKDALIENELVKTGIYSAINTANPTISYEIVWEKGKELGITADDSIKQSLLDFMGIKDEE